MKKCAQLFHHMIKHLLFLILGLGVLNNPHVFFVISGNTKEAGNDTTDTDPTTKTGDTNTLVFILSYFLIKKQ